MIYRDPCLSRYQNDSLANSHHYNSFYTWFCHFESNVISVVIKRCIREANNCLLSNTRRLPRISSSSAPDNRKVSWNKSRSWRSIQNRNAQMSFRKILMDMRNKRDRDGDRQSQVCRYQFKNNYKFHLNLIILYLRFLIINPVIMSTSHTSRRIRKSPIDFVTNNRHHSTLKDLDHVYVRPDSKTGICSCTSRVSFEVPRTKRFRFHDDVS